MQKQIQSFRAEVIERVLDAQRHLSGGHLHLIYSPELADPLRLKSSDIQRDTASIMPKRLPKEWAGDDFPRVVTLDCTRIAKYLLDTDAGRDDPLFEASISQVYSEVVLNERASLAIVNDNPGPSESAICGWVVSRQTASQFAHRVQSHAYPARGPSDRIWVRWHNPVYLFALWPALESLQRKALLGDAIWIVHDLQGTLRSLHVEGDTVDQRDREIDFRADEMQWRRFDNAQTVAQLLRNWRAQSETGTSNLPEDASDRLMKHLLAACRLGLRGDNRAIYAMTLSRVSSDAEDVPEWKALIEQTVRGEMALRDGLVMLPEHFWIR